MLFSSTFFLLIFFPLTFTVYYLFCFSRRLQNYWLLLMSLIFYAWGEPVNVLIMIAAIIVAYILGIKIGRNREAGISTKTFVIIAFVYNLGILFIFKYLAFIIRNMNSLSFVDLPVPRIALPIGISFFTFQILSYIMDVNNGTTRYQKSIFNLGLYISLFPQLVAGPIVQYNSVNEQIENRRSSFDKIGVGVTRFIAGMAKKILLSNNFAIMADTIFNLSAIGQERYEVSVSLAWLGSIAYSLQIYYDFSGYSDMAIGLGLMFGFKFPENFNFPYIATSMTEFWRRWHISLSSWFRDYLYIPLGGNRKGTKDTQIRNLFIVWVTTGIWHGAEWNFLFWGIWHFIFLLSERFFGYTKGTSHSWLRHIYTILVFNFGWVIFKAPNLYQAGRYMMNMLGLNGNGLHSDLTLVMFKEFWIWLVLGVIFAMPLTQWANQMLTDKVASKSIPSRIMTIFYPVSMILLFIVCAAYLARGAYNPFIYFNF